MKKTELTFGQKLADKVTVWFGSWRGFLTQVGIIAGWMVFNTLTPSIKLHFDPFPYIFLNLALSMQAALSASLILMASNRAAEGDRRVLKDAYVTELDSTIILQEIVARLDKISAEIEKLKNEKEERA